MSLPPPRSSHMVATGLAVGEDAGVVAGKRVVQDVRADMLKHHALVNKVPVVRAAAPAQQRRDGKR